jgi:tRNA pseudouridine38-40 synthase
VRTLKLTIAYDGTSLVGWQRQAHGTSVQGLLEAALARVAGQPVRVVGAGRTDAGAHATGQVASAALDIGLDPATLRRALNAMLPGDVRVLAIEDAPPGFHARYAARSKTYQYRILNGPIVPPFVRRYVWHVPRHLDEAAMDAAARLLEGEHDFAAFQASGSHASGTTRVLTESRMRLVTPTAPNARAPAVLPDYEPEGRLLLYAVTGTGFLRHMVRTIVGTLVEIGTGRVSPHGMLELLESRAREQAGPTAPACGLCLVAVTYEDAV